MQPNFRSVPVLDLLLDRENPRHVEKDSQEEVISYLLADEEVHNLARHMAANGINPLEVVAVFPDDDGNLVVAEGNRRICAAQLLTDPEKAPESARARFRSWSAKARDVSQVNVAEFPDLATAKPWLQVLHDGEQDGVGRRRWKPEQKARATSGKSTDALAVAVLDYAEQAGILSADQRRKILVSTATRYLANPEVRDAMGLLSGATSDNIEIKGTEERFAKAVADFIDALLSKRLHSRSKSDEWLAYARAVIDLLGPVEQAGLPKDLTKRKGTQRGGSRSKGKTRVRVVTPETKFISSSDRIASALNDLESFKMSSLYSSLTSVRLDENPVLMITGSWSFIESLCTLHGKTSGSDFVAYLMSVALALGLSKDEAKDCKLSLDYISLHGNAGKHSGKFAPADARNLHNHFEVLDGMLVALIRECAAKR